MRVYLGLLMILSWNQINDPTPGSKSKLMGVVFNSIYLEKIKEALIANKIDARTSIEQNPNTIRYLGFSTKKYPKAKSVLIRLRKQKKIGVYYFMTYEELEKNFFPPLNAIDSLKIRRGTEMFQMGIQKQRDGIFFKF
ncbi:hypothetical protein [Spirosoma utsteinense]|uniref:Uncharacterized protein n=1 Tax=Spirosoma utsteinense TaxID=2585773 RepID=A0ABR6WEQ8_9BACT|nr:hypothetical protein [Spirosoma utsteinense]MBC3794978.1 hypothetical protein [Spirosoma utsteinense]